MLTNAQVTEAYKTAESIVRRTAAKYGWFPTPDDVADLVQETVLRVHQSFDAEKGTIGAYTWRLATNQTVDYLKGRTAGAIKNDATSLEGTDEDGNHTTMDVVDDSSNPFALIAAKQLDSELQSAIDGLGDSGKQAIGAFLADDTAMSGADRVAKMRAVETIAESLKASHGVRANGKAKATKPAKKSKPSAEALEAPEVRGLLRLSTLTMWNYVTSQKLVVVGPCEAPSPSVDEGWTEAA